MQILPVIISNYNIGTEPVIMYKYYEYEHLYYLLVMLLVLVTPSGLVILILIYTALKLTNILLNGLCPCFKESTSRKSF